MSALINMPFADPKTFEALEVQESGLVNPRTRELIAPIIKGIPRFVAQEDDYATSFGWQWKKWHSTLSDQRSGEDEKRRLLRARTHFEEYDLTGLRILECGMGGGDDTEILLDFPFAEVHSFDLSTAVERAVAVLDDPRLVVSQASIFEIPYRDRSFDVVFCHRVLQHTPNPSAALRSICRKVKPGGILFAHVYLKSWRYLMKYKYKYRPIARRLSHQRVYELLERYGPQLYRLNSLLHRNRLTGLLGNSFMPFEWLPNYGQRNDEDLLQLAKLVTFDALTPRYDRPMSSRRFRALLEQEGFAIEHFSDRSPLYATARLIKS